MSEIGRYFVAEQPHEPRCYSPHCGCYRYAVIDRVSGQRITALHDLGEAEVMAARLNTEWEEYERPMP